MSSLNITQKGNPTIEDTSSPINTCLSSRLSPFYSNYYHELQLSHHTLVVKSLVLIPISLVLNFVLLDMSMLRREHAQGEKSAQRFDLEQSHLSCCSSNPPIWTFYDMLPCFFLWFSHRKQKTYDIFQWTHLIFFIGKRKPSSFFMGENKNFAHDPAGDFLWSGQSSPREANMARRSVWEH